MRVVDVESVPDEGLSHDPRILKRVLTPPGGISGLTQFARSVIPPGCATTTHAHADMTEVFYVLSGRGRADVDSRPCDLAPGICLRIDPGEWHVLEAAPDTPLTLLYFGLAPKGSTLRQRAKAQAEGDADSR